MNKFEVELKKGNFIIGECPNCNLVIWPPSDYCSNCFGNVKWRKTSKNGKLIEFSKKEKSNFCVAEFEKNIRILGTLKASTKEPQVGQRIRLESCNFDGGHYNFFLVLD